VENILDRIKQIADNEQIKITTLERKIGASKGVLSRAISMKTDIQLKWVQVLVEIYPQYSVEWLLTGKGKMLKNTVEKPEDKTKKVLELEEEYRRQAAEIAELKEKIRELQNEMILQLKEIVELQKNKSASTGYGKAIPAMVVGNAEHELKQS
jgi:hypothetical protein